MGGKRTSLLHVVVMALVQACGDPSTAPERDGIDPRWSAGVPLPVALTGVAAVVFNGSIYVAGGESEAGESLAVFRYSPGGAAWERLEDLPGNRVFGRLLVAEGTLFLVGGMELDPHYLYARTRRVFRYQPAEGRWVERASVPDPRDGVAASVPGAIVMVGGGPGDPEHGGLYPGDSVVVYDAAADEWRYGAPIRTRRNGPMAVTTGADVYVFGGRSIDGTRVVDEIEIYNAVSDTWRAGGALLPAFDQVGWQAYARAGDHVHFFGGFAALRGGLIDMHARYRISTGDWDILPALPTPRYQSAAVAVGGSIYVIGGRVGPRGAFLNSVLIFDADPES